MKQRTGQKDRRIADVPKRDWPIYNIVTERRKTVRRVVTETITTTVQRAK